MPRLKFEDSSCNSQEAMKDKPPLLYRVLNIGEEISLRRKGNKKPVSKLTCKGILSSSDIGSL